MLGFFTEGGGDRGGEFVHPCHFYHYNSCMAVGPIPCE